VCVCWCECVLGHLVSVFDWGVGVGVCRCGWVGGCVCVWVGVCVCGERDSNFIPLYLVGHLTITILKL